jgi:hypothetical protein
MKNIGLMNYKIISNGLKEYYLPISFIAPDSYNNSQYYGYDILSKTYMDKFFKNIAIDNNVGYLYNHIYEGKNTLHMVKTTYFGTDIPKKDQRLAQRCGYFIVSLDLKSLTQELENSFPGIYVTLEQNDSFIMKKAPIDIFSERSAIPFIENKFFYINYFAKIF